MEKTIEQKVAATVLQKDKEITIGNRVFSVAPPSVATLILASEAVSLMPSVELNPKNILSEVLFVAKDCRILGDVVAILILGAKNLKEKITEQVEVKRRFRRPQIETVEKVIDRKAELSKWLLEELEPVELRKLFSELIHGFQLGDFFGLTTFLIETNLLRPTKVD